MSQIKSFQHLFEQQFSFLKRKSILPFIESKKRTQRRTKKQVQDYFNWLNKTFLFKHMAKYNLTVKKIQLDWDYCGDIIVDIKNEHVSPLEDVKISMYRQKEKWHISDKAFQSFINAGASQFPSTSFIKECRAFLN